jgi:alpha-tubulin suppressor-like RCC1 family protein
VALPAVAVGQANTLVLKNDGTVWTFGSNGFGQLGNPYMGPQVNAVPQQVTGLTGVVEIAGGNHHSVALKADGTVWTFGLNDYGQLGYATSGHYNPTPRVVPGLNGVVDISAGWSFSTAVKGDGTLWTFGDNGYGQLGYTTASIHPNPIPQQVPGLTNVTAVAAGGQHTVALSHTGKITTFGHNFYGQLGYVTPNAYPNSAPAHVPELDDVIEVAASGITTIALKRDGTAWTFGFNGDGQLGYETTNYFDHTPRPVPGFTTIQDIATASAHSSFVLRNGSMWTFGNNDSGQLGYPTPGLYRNPTPNQVPSLTGITSVAAGLRFTVTLKSDGTIWTFGANNYGQLGYVTTNGSVNSTPRAIGGFNVFASADTPARVLDTRIGGSTIDGAQQGLGALAPNTVLELPLAGRGPISPSVAAVALNVTVTGPTGAGYLTVWPCGTAQPIASNLNFVSGQTIANLTIAKIGIGGKVCLAVSGASAHVIADYNEQYSFLDAPLRALPPFRLLDTRPGGSTIDGLQQGDGLVSASTVLRLPILNRGGSGSNTSGSDTNLIVLNVTVTGATGPGYLTVWPCGTAQPNASSLNYLTGDTIANLVVTKPGIDGTVCISPSQSATHVLADLAAINAPGSSRPITARTPDRILDTRLGAATVDALLAGGGLVPANTVISLPVRGRVDVGNDVTSAILNVTITGPLSDGYLTVWPCGQLQPNASNINFVRGQTIPNSVITRLGGQGRVCLTASADTHMVADLTATS